MTGAAKYTVDIHHDGQLEGVILRSHVAHARIIELDSAPHVRCPAWARSIPLLDDDRTVRYVGDPIAAVAAIDRKTAHAALAAIKTTAKPAVAAIGLDEARKPDAPVVFEIRSQEGRQCLRRRRFAGTVEKEHPRSLCCLFEEAQESAQWVDDAREANNPFLVDGTFRTGTQPHACLEPHAAVARFDGDHLTVHVSTQAVFHLRS